MGKKSGGKAPAAPDPVATAQAQFGLSKDAAVAQANLNRINQVGPQGSITYSQIGTNADGTPQYQQNTSLSAAEQQKYDLQNQAAVGLSQLAGEGVQRVRDAQSQPFSYDGMTGLKTSLDLADIPNIRKLQQSLDYSGLTALPGTSDFGAEQKRMADSVYSQAASRLDPQWQQSDGDLKSQLAAQGISENSDAYRRALDNQARAKTDAYNQANFSAQQAGSAEQSRLFGLALGARQQGQSEVNDAGQYYNNAQQQTFDQQSQRTAMHNQNQTNMANFNNAARQQQIAEATQQRQMPLQEMATLLSTAGGAAMPDYGATSQVGVAAPDYMGAVQNNYTNQMNAYNQQQANRSAGLGSIFGALGSVGGAAIMASDRRVKENVKRIGTLANGLPTYTFNYIGDKAKQFGVMAQEALKIIPDAVGQLPNGVLYVNYGKVY